MALGAALVCDVEVRRAAGAQLADVVLDLPDRPAARDAQQLRLVLGLLGARDRPDLAVGQLAQRERVGDLAPAGQAFGHADVLARRALVEVALRCEPVRRRGVAPAAGAATRVERGDLIEQIGHPRTVAKLQLDDPARDLAKCRTGRGHL